MLQSQADVRLRLGAHAHFTRRLHAEQAAHIGFVQHLRPSAVGQNHQLAHHGINRRAALAHTNAHVLMVVHHNAVIVLRRASGVVFAARLLLGNGKIVEPVHLCLMRESLGLAARLLRQKQRFNILDAQIFANPYCFHLVVGGHHFVIRVHFGIQAHRRAVLPGIQAKRSHPFIRQHGDFAAGIIHRTLAGKYLGFHIVACFHGQRRRGNVDADKVVAIGQNLQA